jgi:hypothetical protein
MSSTLAKQIAVVVLALIGIVDAHWGTQFLGHLTAEVVTIAVTLALAALGFVELRDKHPKPIVHS